MKRISMFAAVICVFMYASASAGPGPKDLFADRTLVLSVGSIFSYDRYAGKLHDDYGKDDFAINLGMSCDLQVLVYRGLAAGGRVFAERNEDELHLTDVFYDPIHVRSNSYLFGFGPVLYYYFNINNVFVPFAGFGFSYSCALMHYRDDGGGDVLRYTEHRVSLEPTVGLGFFFTEYFGIYLAYAYHRTMRQMDNLEISRSVNGYIVADYSRMEHEYIWGDEHGIVLGFKILFDAISSRRGTGRDLF
jgi:hypothetical protein